MRCVVWQDIGGTFIKVSALRFATSTLEGIVASRSSASSSGEAPASPVIEMVPPATSTVTTLVARAADVVPGPSDPARRDGSLADDFVIQRAPHQLHVLNAPSPAATSALEIAAHLLAEAGFEGRPGDLSHSAASPRAPRA